MQKIEVEIQKKKMVQPNAQRPSDMILQQHQQLRMMEMIAATSMQRDGALGWC